MPIQDAPPFDYIGAPAGGVYFNQPAATPGAMNEWLASQAPEDTTALPTTPEQDKWIAQRNEDERLAALGVNPLAARKARAEAEEMAIRQSGLMKIRKALDAGLPYPQAFATGATELLFQHPDKLATFASEFSPGMPTSINTLPINDPRTGKPAGIGVFGPKGNLHAVQFDPRVNPEEAAGRNLAGKDLNAIYAKIRDLEKAKLDPLNAPKMPDINRQLVQLQSDLEAARKTYMNPRGIEPPTSTATQAPFKEGSIVRDKRNQKLYRIENGVPVELKQ